MRNAKEISHVVGVTLALSLLPFSAGAGVGADILRTSDTPEFVIGSGMSAGTISLRNADAIWPPDGPVGRQDVQTGAVGTIQFGATGFTLAPSDRQATCVGRCSIALSGMCIKKPPRFPSPRRLRSLG
jgi:hypothetical protein